MSYARRLCLLLLALLSLAATCAGTPTETLYSLEGTVRIFMCPEGDYRLPEDNKAGWTEVLLTPYGLEGKLPHDRGIAWVTITFDLPCTLELSKPYTLLLTDPPDAEEVYVNGVLLGGEGTVGPPYAISAKGPHSIAFAGGVFHCGPNRLTIRMLLAKENINLLRGPLYFDQADRIQAKYEKLNESTVALESGILAAITVLFVFYFILILSGTIRSEYLLFTAFLGGQLALFLLDSNFLDRFDLTGTWVPHVQHPLSMIVGFLMLALVTDLTDFPRRGVYWFFATATGVFIGFYLLVPPISVLYLFTTPQALFSTLRGVAYILMSLRAVIRRQPEAIPILVGISIYVLGTRLDILLGTDWGIYSLLLFSIAMLFVLARRHARLRDRILAISARLLDAQEEERRRLAREIHDGVGQTILALKLKLQMLLNRCREGGAPTPSDLEGLVAETSALAEEVRRTAHDIRPAFVGDMGLEEAIRWYADHFMERTSMEILIHQGDSKVGELPPRVKDNLYRIFQEALTNSARHAQAKRFDATLFREGRKIVFVATDDGKGFDVSTAMPKGIGLATMQERASILGGDCHVESHPGRGTTIRVEVPLR